MKKIIIGCAYSILCMLADYISVIIPLVLFQQDLHLLLQGTLRIPYTLLYIILIAILIFIVHYLFNTKTGLSFIQKGAFIAISMIGLLVGHLILRLTMIIQNEYQDQHLSLALVTVNLFFILLFLFLLFFIYHLGISKEQNMELLEKQKNAELEEQEYKNLIRSTESLREVKHEMQHHLSMISSLIEKQDLEELRNYINSYDSTLKNTNIFPSTGNTAIDCILASKLDQAKKKEITVSYSVIISKDFPLSPLLLTSLLGNLWNNALEACENQKLTQPDCTSHIDFYIKPFNHMIAIHIENDFNGNIKMDSQGNLLSLKKGSEHGIGLKRIQEIVEDVNGILMMDHNEQRFTVHIMLPQERTGI